MRYDTEATKSLGLVELLLQEKAHPRCDVFWNNELLGTLQLADEGLLLPYRGSGYERIPAAFKDADGRWAGFAARLRLWIVNTNRLAPTEAAIQQAASGDLDRMVIAKPLYGTTRTQYTVLWKLWGRDKLLAWDRDRRARHLREVDGNSDRERSGRRRRLRSRLDRHGRFLRGAGRRQAGGDASGAIGKWKHHLHSEHGRNHPRHATFGRSAKARGFSPFGKM